MSWAFETTDREGTTTGFVVPRQVVIDRKLNGATTATITADSDQASDLVMGRLVKGWRTPNGGGTRVLRVHNQVVQVESSGGLDSIERVQVSTTDGFGMSWNRLMLFSLNFVANTPAVICDAFLDNDEPIRGTLGLYIDNTATSGPPRDRTYDYGKPIGEAIQQLAEVDDGFWFRVDPYEGTRDDVALFSELVFLYPGSGDDLDIAFEYGAGGQGNLASVGVSVQPPTNYVVAVGAGEVGSQLYSIQSDVASMEAFGVYQVNLNRTDVSEQTTLDQLALDALRPDPRTIYSCTPVRFGENLPTPWEAFDVGDTLWLRLRGEAPYLTATIRCRVTAFQVTIDDSGVELLTGLTLEAV